jgi:hypothetical protein
MRVAIAARGNRMKWFAGTVSLTRATAIACYAAMLAELRW